MQRLYSAPIDRIGIPRITPINRINLSSMNRRHVLRTFASLGPAVLAGPSLLARLAGGRGPASTGLYLDDAIVERARANAASGLLQPMFTDLKAEVDSWPATLETFKASGDLLSDYSRMMQAMDKASVVALIDGDERAIEFVHAGIEHMLSLPHWDYFIDAEGKVLGIMRSSAATATSTLAMEAMRVAGRPLDEARLLADIAEKGALPCYHAIHDMDHPSTAHGWGVMDGYEDVYMYDMRRWPYVFSDINLRAVPTMGLGLGALATLDTDPRAEAWLDVAIASAQHFLRLFQPEGSYDEGLSYLDYGLRTVLQFCEAYDRIRGDVDWTDDLPIAAVAEHIAVMQLGRRNDDGHPDTVNFSDAARSTSIAVPSWLAKHGSDALAQYNAIQFSQPRYPIDFLWFDRDRPSAPPQERLKNVRMDLDWVVVRTGWDEQDTMLAFRGGEPANHEHADRNSFILKAHGERLLTDPFGASYDPRRPHWLLRESKAHNTVVVGGQGQPYNDGDEGTNAGTARAEITRYVDRGDIVWWTSDATHSYLPSYDDTLSVRRTMIFAKPNLVLVFDEADLRNPGAFEVRFHPDNRDGQAGIDVSPNGFVIRRPQAILTATVHEHDGDLNVAQTALELPEEYGAFPYAAVARPDARRHRVLTVMTTQPTEGSAEPSPVVERTETGWTVTRSGQQITIDASGLRPDVRWRPA
ncbi:MAG: heparinase II/III family protein, partial [Bacteroidota bacterium]